jgi:hypothetical protein
LNLLELPNSLVSDLFDDFEDALGELKFTSYAPGPGVFIT